jgi:hypothetical protein
MTKDYVKFYSLITDKIYHLEICDSQGHCLKPISKWDKTKFLYFQGTKYDKAIVSNKRYFP